MALEAKRVIVHGRVQGVGFRYFVQRTARRLGLVGSVRNREDGAVEVVVEGEETTLAEFLRHVRAGPPMSRVERVDEEPVAPAGGFTRFNIEGW